MAASVPSYWREQPQRYRYEANTCKECGKVFFPPRRSCGPWCDCTLEPHTMATTGKLLTYTVIHVGPTQFGDEVPYVLGICEMADGARITAQVVDLGPEGPAVGMPVRIEFRKVQQDGEAGILMYGYKVAPAGQI
jgi:scaffold protein (connect acetoacetyl-CoA thiolase and HMG-CoA synthase)